MWGCTVGSLDVRSIDRGHGSSGLDTTMTARAVGVRIHESSLLSPSPSTPPPPLCLSVAYLQLHSCQEMLGTQLENTVIVMLSTFLSEDVAKLERLKECYDGARQGERGALHQWLC